MASSDPDQPASPGRDVTREMVLVLAFGQELTRVTRRLDEADKRAAGFEAQLAKPVDPWELCRVVAAQSKADA